MNKGNIMEELHTKIPGSAYTVTTSGIDGHEEHGFSSEAEAIAHAKVERSAGVKFFVHDLDGDFEVFDTEEEAKNCVQEALDYWRNEGWPNGTPSIHWGVLMGGVAAIWGSPDGVQHVMTAPAPAPAADCEELHTKTPWYCENDAIYDNPECEGNPIAHVLSCMYSADGNAADARRIVACVNHCAGLDTVGMEMGTRLGRTARVYLDELVGQCAEAEHQRNELQRELVGAREAIQRANERWYSAKRDAEIAEGERDALKAQYDQLREVLERANQVLTGMDAAVAAAKGGA